MSWTKTCNPTYFISRQKYLTSREFLCYLAVRTSPTIDSEDRKLYLPIRLESPEHLHLRFYPSNPMLAVHLHQGWDHDNPEDISKLGARRKTEDKDSAPLITNQQLPEASSQPTLQAVAPQLDRIREVIPPHTADQGQAVHIRHLLNNPPTRGRGRRRRGGTRGGHAGNSIAKANRIW